MNFLSFFIRSLLLTYTGAFVLWLYYFFLRRIQGEKTFDFKCIKRGDYKSDNSAHGIFLNIIGILFICIIIIILKIADSYY